jgi:hypothetical protein
MKNVLRILTFAALLTTFSLPAFAQDAAATGGATTAASPQEEEAKAALYGEFVQKIKVTDAASQKRAYEIGKEYLTKYGNPTTDADKQVVDYIKKWVAKYEAATLEYEFFEAIKNNNFTRAFELGRQLLASNPDRLDVRLLLTYAGTTAASKGDKSLTGEAITHARAALQAIEQGKAPQKWVVWPNKDEAVLGLNISLAQLLSESAPQEAIITLIKGVQAEGPTKNSARLYTLLGATYYNSDFKKLAEQYKQQCEGKDASPECDALFAKINNALDHIIDAYARAVAYGKDAKLKAAVQKDLTAVYKIRFQSVAANPEPNIQQLVAGITALPVPQPGAAVTLPGAPAAPDSSASTTPPASPSAPAATPTPTPAASNTTAKPATNGAKPAAQPASPKPMSKAPAAKRAAKGRARA